MPAVQEMYASFKPLGFAKGLPPMPGEKTRRWLQYLAGHGHSLVAESDGGFVGHAVLAESGPGEAELAVFVHQDFRHRGVGAALAAAAVEYAGRSGYRTLWATASPANIPAIRMVESCGFRVRSGGGASDVELELAVGDHGAK